MSSSMWAMDRRANREKIVTLLEKMTTLLEHTGPPLTPAPGKTFLSLEEDELEHLIHVLYKDSMAYGLRPW